MAMDGVQLEISGDKRLRLAFGKMPLVVQKKVVRPALRKSAKRLRLLVIQAFSGFPVGVVTGNALFAMGATKVRSRSTKQGAFADIVYPEIDGFPYMWTTLEYGSKTVAARAPIRKTADANEAKEQAKMLEDVEKGIEKQWARLAR